VTEFRSVRTEAELPRRIELGEDEGIAVPSFPLAETAIERGADSARVRVGEQPHRPAERVLVVLPTYDERDNLAPMVAAVGRHLVADVLVVDDGSPDGTGAIADGLAAEHAHVHVLHRASKDGLGRACLAGFAWALERGYDLVVTMDCDFSHAPWDLPRLVHAAGDADLVIGSRYVKGGATDGWNFRRRLLSRGGNLYASLFLGARVRDWTAGFRCYRASLLRALDLDGIRANGYSFQIEMAFRTRRAGRRVLEIPVRFVDREEGRSKMTGAIALEAVRVVPTLRLRG